jgi:hypothetical protein
MRPFNRRDERDAPIIHLETDFGLAGRMARTKKEGNRALTIPIADAA